MELNDFLILLVKRYGSPKSEQVAIDIRNYYQIKKIDFDSAYDRIVQEYEQETFPNLAKIKKIVGDSSGIQKSNRVDMTLEYKKRYIQESQGWPIEKLLKICNIINQKILRSEELQFLEIELLHYWSDLWGSAEKLKDKKGHSNLKTWQYPDIINYCEAIKRNIIQGFGISNFNDEVEKEGVRSGMTAFKDIKNYERSVYR